MSAAAQQAVSDRTHELTAFHEHAEWTGVTSDDRMPWLEMRRTMVTASDMAAILGEDEWRSPLRVYTDKIMPPKDEKLAIDDPRFWGLKLEQRILEIVAEYHGWGFRPSGALLRSRRHPFIGATLDGEVDRGEGWLPYEGKTTRVPKDWGHDWKQEEGGQIPNRVMIQVQTQLLVTGADSEIVFGLLQGSRPCMVEVEPYPELHALFVEESERFLERVRLLNPPPPSQHRDERQALADLYLSGEQTHSVMLPPEALEWTRDYFQLGKEIKELEKRREHLQNLVIAAMGNAKWGLLSQPVENKAAWRHQLQKRAGYTVAPSSYSALLPMKDWSLT